MKYNKKIVESILSIYLFTKVDFLRLDFKNDNLEYLLNEELELLNNSFIDFFVIKIIKWNIVFEYKDFSELILIWNDYLKLFYLLYWEVDNVRVFINLELSNKFKEEVKFFLDFLEIGWHNEKIGFLDYIETIENFKLRKMLLFIVYWIWNDTEFNTTKSINILSSIIDKYPKFASFYLLRMRQMFNLVYKIIIWTHKFNKLVTSIEWKKYLLKNKFIENCFYDLDRADKLLPNFYITNLFRWKILLHLLDKSWLKYIELYLKQVNKVFDINVYSWFWVYYLQVWNLYNAEKYLTLINYEPEDRYKAYSKLLFLYLKSSNEIDFKKFINKRKNNRLVLLYDKWNYYKLNNEKLVLLEDIDDNYNHRDKMWFKLNNFEKILNWSFKNKDEYFNIIFNNISKNYYDHWYSWLEQKVVFYSLDNYKLW